MITLHQRVKRKKCTINLKKINLLFFIGNIAFKVIKSNQVILIQIVKEERGNKGAAVTTRLSIRKVLCAYAKHQQRGGHIKKNC